MDNKIGRPLGKEGTVAKTYSFFSRDIEEMLTQGYTPKEVFRLGIYAKKNNPIILQRVKELEDNNLKMSLKLQKACQRLIELEGTLKLE